MSLADGQCQMVIDTEDESELTVTSSFFRVWWAAEHATAKCVRASKAGYIPIAGSFGPERQPTGVLRVTIEDEPAQLVLPGGNNEARPAVGAGATA